MKKFIKENYKGVILGLVCAIVISWNYICNVLTIKFK